jgi:Caspase domain
MKKVALLIGVSEYGVGLNPLPCTVKDVEAMLRVLKNPEIGDFDEVKQLINPDPLKMQEEIEGLFSGRTNNDLVVLYFSGHGIKDDSGKLYFATGITRKNIQGELVKATAVPASFVHDVMGTSRSRRQVLVLDCCFSGAFAKGLSAKDDDSVHIKTLFGGEGRVVLTSSTSTQYSFEQQHQGLDLSIYTRCLVEGIETGMADRDHDGMVSVDELHEYASEKVRDVQPTMKPEIYAIKEGFKIKLTKAPFLDPKLAYSRKVAELVSINFGKISDIGRITLDAWRGNLELSVQEANIIEADVLRPYQEYEAKLRRYEEELLTEIRHHWPLSEKKQQEFKEFQKSLKLKDEDVERIQKIIFRDTTVQQPAITSKSSVAVNYRRRVSNFFCSNALYLSLCMFLGILSLGTMFGQSNTQPTPTTKTVNSTPKKLTITKENCERFQDKRELEYSLTLREYGGKIKVDQIINDCARVGVKMSP